MLKNTIYITIIIFVMLFTGCEKNGGSTVKNYEHISQKSAKEIIDTENGYIILDVRTEEEYDEGHIMGAICIPNESIDEGITSVLLDKNQLILVYCRSGNRSVQASEKLVKLGYSNIKEFGGIMTWEYETEQEI